MRDHEIAHLDAFRAQRPAGRRRGAGRARHIACSFAIGPTSCFACSGGSSRICQIIGRYFGLSFASAAIVARVASGFPSADAVLEAPGGLEVVGVIGGLALIEVDNPLDGVLLAVRLHQHGMRREVEPVGSQHHVIAHFARRLQVLIQQGGRHGQRFAGVIEAGRVRRVHRKLARGTNVHAGEVADGVVVLGIAEAAHQHRPGIAIVLLRLVGRTAWTQSITCWRASAGRLRQRLRRHLFGGQSLQHQGPARIVVDHGRPLWSKAEDRTAPPGFRRHGTRCNSV